MTCRRQAANRHPAPGEGEKAGPGGAAAAQVLREEEEKPPLFQPESHVKRPDEVLEELTQEAEAPAWKLAEDAPVWQPPGEPKPPTPGPTPGGH